MKDIKINNKIIFYMNIKTMLLKKYNIKIIYLINLINYIQH